LQNVNENSQEGLSAYFEKTKTDLPAFRLLNIDSAPFAEAGMNLTQQLAAKLAKANEYVVHLTGKGFSAEDIITRLQFSASVGTDYFLEIARLRALRMLWANISEAYKASNTGIFVHAVNGAGGQTITDPY